jgi:uncharacterized membrane protein YuzA (DUF378 family)
MYMNIRLKAALEVVSFILSAIMIGVVGRLGLDYLAGLYGNEQVFNGIVFAGITVGTIILLKLMYDVRLAQLNYERKLKEIIKK